MQKIRLILIIIPFYSFDALGQYDSLKSYIPNKYQGTEQLDSIRFELNKKGIDQIITYGWFSNFGYYAVTLWKDDDQLKFKEMSERNRKLELKNRND